MKLYHCHNARSLRPLWALEEIRLHKEMDYELELLPFPPRMFQKEFLGINPLGTVPYFIDGETRMTESSGICHYLAEKYAPNLRIAPEHAEYGDYLNWLYHSDATLTFPQAIFIRYSILEPKERRQPQVADDYAKWFIARLRMLDAHIKDKDFLCDGRFTMADIAIGYALFLGELNNFSERYTPQVADYLAALKQRPAFRAAIAKSENNESPSLIGNPPTTGA